MPCTYLISVWNVVTAGANGESVAVIGQDVEQKSEDGWNKSRKEYKKQYSSSCCCCCCCCCCCVRVCIGVEWKKMRRKKKGP